MKNAGVITKAQQRYVEAQLEIQAREKRRREVLGEKVKAKRQRKHTSKAMTKRTNKGQPVMHLQMKQLLGKIEKGT